jgi:hypothetical protein
MYKNLYITVVLVLGLASVAVPMEVLAQSSNVNATREAQIRELLAQIAELQKLLNSLQSAQESAVSRQTDSFVLLSTTYFGTDFAAVYSVDDTIGLLRRDGPVQVRPTDRAIWNLVVSTLGTTTAKRYIDEFRVYENPNSVIGGFVELHQKNEDRYWIFGVNADGFDATDRDARASYQQLFIHELSHLFLSEEPQLLTSFTDTFWRVRDHQHAARVATLNDKNREAAISRYFSAYPTDFVSDYATLSPEEDFAETFAQFVLEPMPRTATTKRDQKIMFMQREPYLLAWRTTLRNNLDI